MNVIIAVDLFAGKIADTLVGSMLGCTIDSFYLYSKFDGLITDSYGRNFTTYTVSVNKLDDVAKVLRLPVDLRIKMMRKHLKPVAKDLPY